MRNKLAEDVLDENMLILMKSFQTFLGTQGDELNDTIKLLEQTSTIIIILMTKDQLMKLMMSELRNYK